MRRRNVLLLVLGTVVLSAGTTWIAGAQIRSPAEVAARTAPPAPSPILVPVESKVLTTRVVARGTGHYSSPRKLSVTSSELKSGARVVTRLPKAGSVLSSGAVLLTISGRPTFVLKGAEPSYRDLGPGMSGRDVAQLEEALSRAHLRPGVVDGVFDQATGAAVARMYHQHGFEPLVADEARLESSRPAEAELIAGARASAGTQLPADEVVFVPRTPVRVTERNAQVGSAPDGELVTVTDLRVVVDGLVPVEQADLVKPGARVLIDEPALGIQAGGRISRVAARPGTEGADGFHSFFEVAVDDPPAALVGTSVRLTIPVRSTQGARLTVPVSALSLGPDGGSRVQRSVDGRISFVPVQPGLSAAGFVAVTPRGGTLHEGDRVVVGFETRRSSGG